MKAKTINPVAVALPAPLADAMQSCARPQCIISLVHFKLWSGFDWAVDIRRVVADGKLAAYAGEWTVARSYDPRSHRALHRVPLDNGQMASLIRMRELFMLKIATALAPPIEADPMLAIPIHGSDGTQFRELPPEPCFAHVWVESPEGEMRCDRCNEPQV